LGDVLAWAVVLVGVAAGVVAGVPVLGVVITIPVCEENEEEADTAARNGSAWPRSA
jgi:hypothetical protein